MVYPPAPLKPKKVTLPEQTAIILLPVGAAISIPEWLVEAPDVGAFRLPKQEVIVVQPGVGHKNSLLLKMVVQEIELEDSNESYFENNGTNEQKNKRRIRVAEKIEIEKDLKKE